MKRLASALWSGNVKGVHFVDDDTNVGTEYAAVTDGLQDGVGEARVSVGRASTNGDSATGTLDWRWKVGPTTWSFETEVKLSRGETGARGVEVFRRAVKNRSAPRRIVQPGLFGSARTQVGRLA